MKTVETVIEVEWTEKERGWGQRPDGYSYYVDMESAETHIKKYWADMPIEAPDCYSAPSSPKRVFVDPLFALLVKNKGIAWSDKSVRIDA